MIVAEIIYNTQHQIEVVIISYYICDCSSNKRSKTKPDRVAYIELGCHSHRQFLLKYTVVVTMAKYYKKYCSGMHFSNQ